MRPHTLPGPDADPGIGLDGVAPERAVGWLRQMLLIRQFETVAGPLTTSGAIPGGMHPSVGQEGVAVGVVSALVSGDVVAASHRSHHVALAMGMSPRAMMAELYGKATGCAGGRGGHMHLADFAAGFYGSNGIVGAGAGIALGAAFAQSYRHEPHCSVGFFGDGGANTGRVWEFANLAASWRLPLIMVCENNGYAVETRVDLATAGESIAARARSFGLAATQVDGQDVAAVATVSAQAADRARSGGGPSFIEALTYRFGGHDIGDRGRYRTEEEVAWWQRYRDPISRLCTELRQRGWLGEQRHDELADEAAALVRDAVDFAESSPFPDPATVARGVLSPALEDRSPTARGSA